MMNCKDIKFGTYNCAYDIALPYKVKFQWEDASKYETKQVLIDKCLLPEILSLWEQGIKTTGCCCGHGDFDNSFIGVQPDYISKMKALGYKVKCNSCRPQDEDSFIPKTLFNYDDTDKGLTGGMKCRFDAIFLEKK